MTRFIKNKSRTGPPEKTAYKSPYEEERDKRQIFFLIGLCVALGLTNLAFTWNGNGRAQCELPVPELMKDFEIEVSLIHSEKKEIQNTLSNETRLAPVQPISPEIAVVEKPDPDPGPHLFDPEKPINNLPEPPPEELPPDPPVAPAPPNFYTAAPEFPGGLKAFYKYMGKKVQYTEWARGIHAEGTAWVSFVVNLDGSVTDIKVVRGIHKDLDDQIVEALKESPHWTPGMQGENRVAVQYTVPVNFILNN